MTEKVGPRLKAIRKALHFTGKRMAEKTGYSHRILSSIESGKSKPNIDFIAKSCYIYDVSIDALVFDTDEQFEQLLNDLRGVKL